MAQDFWASSGFHYLQRSRAGLVATDAWLARFLEGDELRPPHEAGPRERNLHERLLRDPRAVVEPAALADVEDEDARDNWTEFLRFRDRVLEHPSLEAVYLDLYRRDAVDLAPPFVDAGAMVVLPDYSLCPAVSVEHIVLQTVQALVWVYRHARAHGGDPQRHPGVPCGPEKLLSVYADAGKTARAPMLWVYTENDNYFGPDYSRVWHKAYTDAGGRAVVQATYALAAADLGAIAITEEPVGGSPQPTGDILIVGTPAR